MTVSKGKKVDYYRTRLRIPQTDEATLQWLQYQDNVSQSIRRLIQLWVEENGNLDPTSMLLEKPKRRRGRPRKSNPVEQTAVKEVPQVTQTPVTPPVARPEKPKASPSPAPSFVLPPSRAQMEADAQSSTSTADAIQKLMRSND